MLTVMKPFDASFSGYLIYPVIAAFGYAISEVACSTIPRRYSISFNPVHTTNLHLFARLRLSLCLSDTDAAGGPRNDAGLFLLMGVFGGTGVMCLVTAYRMADPSSLSF